MKVKVMMILLVLAAAVAVLVQMSGADSRARAADPDGEAKAKPNRLARESSPYLRQHAHNPVDWYPWGQEAFARARKDDKPIFLSVGYSTCHWCHVMAHESFEKDDVAKILNELYVCIKVDREELPDVDAQYMMATQLMTRRGGWPNSVWLTPDGRPWFAGTYFPREDHGGRPGFKSILKQLADVWKTRRPDVEKQADELSEAIRNIGRGAHHEGSATLSPGLADRAVRAFRSNYDTTHGGFGGAPKFPPHGALSILIQDQFKSQDLQQIGIITHTLDAMAAGGVYDHLGGGFHRYATDQRWFLPHFEKMLYDNAQLVRLYADAYVLTQHEGYRRVIDEVFTWLKREMIDEQGGFYSALDADSEGEEGKFYVWSRDEILKILGDEDGQLFARAYGVVEAGNFVDEATRHRPGTNVLYLPKPLADVARETKMAETDLRRRLGEMRHKLLGVRAGRVRPHLDDKVLVGWNGLMIGALAHAGRHLEEPKYIAAAEAAAKFILEHVRHPDGALRRTWRAGKSKGDGYLTDYAFLAHGLLDLHEATGKKDYLVEATKLTEQMVRLFHDPKEGGFFFTGEDHDKLLVRAKDLGGGGNIPDGNGMAAQVLLRLGTLTREQKHVALAAGTLQSFASAMVSQPHGNESLVVGLAQLYETAEKWPEVAAAIAPRPASGADAATRTEPVTVEAFLERKQVRPGDTLKVAIRLAIDKGWHVYSHEPGTDVAIPTGVNLPKVNGLGIGAVRYPKATVSTDPVLKQKINTYEGTATLVVPLTVAKDASGVLRFELQVRTQACDDRRCLQPQTHTLALDVAVGETAGEARHTEIFKAAGAGRG